MSAWSTPLAGISSVLLIVFADNSVFAQPSSGPMLAFPSHVAVDSSGNVYVTDSSRNRVRWLRNSDLDLLGGWGQSGLADGQFNRPTGIAVDINGYFFVADTSNARVQKFGGLSAFRAKWNGLGSGLGNFRPVAVAVDPGDYVYVLDAQTFTVHKLTNDLVYLGSLGGARGSGDGEFSSIGADLAGVAFDPAGNLYISDPGNHRIQKWSLSSDATGKITSATFSGWLGACASGANCDTKSQRSRGFSCTAATCAATAPPSGSSPGQFTNPAGLAVDPAGSLYVADYGNAWIQVFDSAGNPLVQWGGRGSGPGQFQAPLGVAADGSAVYVTDVRNKVVTKFSRDGEFRAVRGGDFQIGASLGYPPNNLDALVDVNSSFVMPGDPALQTRNVAVTFDPIALFHDSLSLSLQCCWNQATGQLVPGAGISAVLSDSSPVTFQEPSSGPPVPSSTARTLTITVNNAPTPGRYLLGITAGNILWGISKQIDVSFEVVVAPPDNTSWQSCSRFTTTGGDTGKIAWAHSLQGEAEAAFGRKLIFPTETSFEVDGLVDIALSGQWKFTIDKAIGLATPLAPTESLVVFRNQATPNDNKEVLPFSLATCKPSGPGLVGASSSLRIDSATSTLLFRSRDKGQWDDIMFLTPGPLSTLFGGRRLTIDWVSR